MSDGSTVYVSNKYLSTIKPVAQQQQQTSKSSGGGSTTPQGGGQQQTSTDTQGPTPGYNPWEDDYSNVVIDTRTEEQKQADIKKTQEASEGITGTIQAGGLGGN